MSKGNEPAFPADPTTHGYSGLTKREYFAIEILKGLMLRYNIDGYADNDAIAESYKMADAMIKASEEVK